MSWLPSADPILGDRRSCDALELIVVPRVPWAMALKSGVLCRAKDAKWLVPSSSLTRWDQPSFLQDKG